MLALKEDVVLESLPLDPTEMSSTSLEEVKQLGSLFVTALTHEDGAR